MVKMRQSGYPGLDVTSDEESRFVIGRNDDPEVVLNSEPFLIGLKKVDGALEQKNKQLVK